MLNLVASNPTPSDTCRSEGSWRCLVRCQEAAWSAGRGAVIIALQPQTWQWTSLTHVFSHEIDYIDWGLNIWCLSITQFMNFP